MVFLWSAPDRRLRFSSTVREVKLSERNEIVLWVQRVVCSIYEDKLAVVFFNMVVDTTEFCLYFTF